MTAACRRAYAYFGWDHSVADMADWIAEDPKSWTELWTAESGGNVIGFMALLDHFVDQLFVLPQWQGCGIGTAMMARAKQSYPAGLTLNCAQQNFPAIAFYVRQGFIPLEHRIHQPEGIGEIIFRWHGR
jgi:ribosomal protein S18 acetylase RimI-like enzyme